MCPSPAQEVARLFVVVPEEDDLDLPGLRLISVRVSPSRLATLDSMAEHAGLSRNAMANELLRVGISAVLGELPDVVREDIEASIVDRMEGDE